MMNVALRWDLRFLFCRTFRTTLCQPAAAHVMLTPGVPMHSSLAMPPAHPKPTADGTRNGEYEDLTPLS